jgi:hypothetical protein
VTGIGRLKNAAKRNVKPDQLRPVPRHNLNKETESNEDTEPGHWTSILLATVGQKAWARVRWIVREVMNSSRSRWWTVPWNDHVRGWVSPVGRARVRCFVQRAVIINLSRWWFVHNEMNVRGEDFESSRFSWTTRKCGGHGWDQLRRKWCTAIGLVDELNYDMQFIAGGFFEAGQLLPTLVLVQWPE